MGVLNVTPDSFSDGGRYADLDAAVAHGLALWAAGADIVDVGGESTRPGAERVDAEEETRRVVPAIRALAGSGVHGQRGHLPGRGRRGRAGRRRAGSSTTSAAGWPTRRWPRRSPPPACPGCSCTGAGTAGTCRRWPATTTWCRGRAGRAAPAGRRRAGRRRRPPATSCSTPDSGFAKTAEHNWALLARLDELTALGFPVLVGASRKAFLGRLLAGPDGTPGPGRRPRGRHGRDQRAGRGDGRLGRAGARGAPPTLDAVEGRPAWSGRRRAPWLTGSR